MVAVVDLGSWSTSPADLYAQQALDSEPPHGAECPCLMCADERARLGMYALETELGRICRRHDERRLGISDFMEVRRGAGY